MPSKPNIVIMADQQRADMCTSQSTQRPFSTPSRSEEDSEYVDLCAESPSLNWLATKPESALRGIPKVVAEVMEITNSKKESGAHFKSVLRFLNSFSLSQRHVPATVRT